MTGIPSIGPPFYRSAANLHYDTSLRYATSTGVDLSCLSAVGLAKAEACRTSVSPVSHRLGGG